MESVTQKNTQADQSGKWQITIPNDFGPGQHTAIIKDQSSGNKGVVIFKNPEKPYLINKIQKVIPEGFFYAMLLIFLIMLLLLVNYFFLSRKNRLKERRKDLQRYLRGIKFASIFCLVLLLALFIAGLAFNKNISWIGLFKKQITKIQEKPFDVTGSIVDTSDGKGVSGLDLSVGNVSIHTSEGGFFSFNSINSSSEIKITAPQLTKALAKKVDGKEMKVLFDYDMYNKLINVIDLESRGKIGDIYDKYLSDGIKNKTSKADFIKNYNSIFTDANILDQKIVIGKVELIKDWVSKKYDIEQKNVISIEAFNGSKSKIFDLIFDGKNWFLVI